jgi:Fic family protein
MIRCQSLPKIYSQDLINNLFKHPYTKIDFVVQDLHVTRKTAAKYLHTLCDAGLLSEIKLGKEIFFLNDELFSPVGKCQQSKNGINYP